MPLGTERPQESCHLIRVGPALLRALIIGSVLGQCTVYPVILPEGKGTKGCCLCRLRTRSAHSHIVKGCAAIVLPAWGNAHRACFSDRRRGSQCTCHSRIRLCCVCTSVSSSSGRTCACILGEAAGTGRAHHHAQTFAWALFRCACATIQATGYWFCTSAARS